MVPHGRRARDAASAPVGPGAGTGDDGRKAAGTSRGLCGRC